MKLVTIDALPKSRAGLIIGDEVLDISQGLSFFSMVPWMPETVTEVLTAGDSAMDLVRKLQECVHSASDTSLEGLRLRHSLTPLDTTKLRAPIERPGILLSGGGNYPSHQVEMMEIVKRGMDPEAFAKLQASYGSRGSRGPQAHPKNIGSIIGPGDSIILPAGAPNMVDWEAEFAAVIGKPCFNVTPEEAAQCIAGYTFMNDLGPRDPAAIAFEGMRQGRPMDFNQIALAKSMPTMAPIGPCVVTSDELTDPGAVKFQLLLNGKLMQDADNAELVYSIAEAISAQSKWYGFQPGDLITMGSPAGVGFAEDPPVYLKDGDVVEIVAKEIGTLRNPVVRSSDTMDALWSTS